MGRSNTRHRVSSPGRALFSEQRPWPSPFSTAPRRSSTDKHNPRPHPSPRSVVSRSPHYAVLSTAIAGELWDIHTVVLETNLFPLHLHSSSPDLLRKTFFFFSPGFEIFVSCGTNRWDEEGFTIPAPITRPWSRLGGAGAGC